MSAIKSVIFALPKSSTIPKPSATKLKLPTSILPVDNIKLENCDFSERRIKTNLSQKRKHSTKHMELGTLNFPIITSDGVVLKQEDVLPIRTKKRRLDHLTWEEKLQRKKLKNRVAAQTSRDRKKAKLDELEEAVNILKKRNEELNEKCLQLKSKNETLISDLKRTQDDLEVLKGSKDEVCKMCQARVGCTESALGSAVSPLNPLQQGGPVPTLFSEFQGDNYMERLGEFAESLLQEVTTGVEASFAEAHEKQNPSEEESSEVLDTSTKVVGSPSSYVEADTNGESIVSDCMLSTPEIIPKPDAVPTFTLSSCNTEELTPEAEMVYGTYDEATNCITIICPEEEYSHRSTPLSFVESMSPASIHSDDTEITTAAPVATEMLPKKLDYVMSDGGYESHDSPYSSDCADTHTLTDLWHESFSELFPSLA